MLDTLCEAEHPGAMRTKLTPQASGLPRHHREFQPKRDERNSADWRAYLTEGAGFDAGKSKLRQRD